LIPMVALFIKTSVCEESVNNFVFSGYDEHNKKKWEVAGSSAEVKGGRIILDKVRAKIYEENGIIDIRAQKGIVEQDKSKIYLRDNVVIRDSHGGFLYTDFLNWDQKNQRIWTDDYVKLVKDNNQIQGKGGELETDLKQAVIKKDVKLNAVPQTIITSSGSLEVDYNKNIAVFKDNVHVVDRRGEIYCDKLTIYFDHERKKIIRAHAQGNVKLRRGNSWSFSSEAIYDVKEGKVLLLGRPKLEVYPEGR